MVCPIADEDMRVLSDAGYEVVRTGEVELLVAVAAAYKATRGDVGDVSDLPEERARLVKRADLALEALTERRGDFLRWRAYWEKLQEGDEWELISPSEARKRWRKTAVIRRGEFSGGSPYVEGTGALVWMIAALWRMGASDEDVLRKFPYVKEWHLGDVRAYVCAHEEEVEREIKEGEDG